MILLRRIGFDLGRAQDGAEKEPRAVFARDEIGVLALPADAGALRQRLFHQRRGIDEHFDVSATLAREPLRELLQFAFDDIVIVAPRRVSGNEAAALLLQQRDRIIGAGVALPHKDRAPRLRPQR